MDSKWGREREREKEQQVEYVLLLADCNIDTVKEQEGELRQSDIDHQQRSVTTDGQRIQSAPMSQTRAVSSGQKKWKHSAVTFSLSHSTLVQVSPFQYKNIFTSNWYSFSATATVNRRLSTCISVYPGRAPPEAAAIVVGRTNLKLSWTQSTAELQSQSQLLFSIHQHPVTTANWLVCTLHNQTCAPLCTVDKKRYAGWNRTNAAAVSIETI